MDNTANRDRQADSAGVRTQEVIWSRPREVVTGSMLHHRPTAGCSVPLYRLAVRTGIHGGHGGQVGKASKPCRTRKSCRKWDTVLEQRDLGAGVCLQPSEGCWGERNGICSAGPQGWTQQRKLSGEHHSRCLTRASGDGRSCLERRFCCH